MIDPLPSLCPLPDAGGKGRQLKNHFPALETPGPSPLVSRCTLRTRSLPPENRSWPWPRIFALQGLNVPAWCWLRQTEAVGPRTSPHLTSFLTVPSFLILFPSSYRTRRQNTAPSRSCGELESPSSPSCDVDRRPSSMCLVRWGSVVPPTSGIVRDTKRTPSRDHRLNGSRSGDEPPAPGLRRRHAIYAGSDAVMMYVRRRVRIYPSGSPLLWIQAASRRTPS